MDRFADKAGQAGSLSFQDVLMPPGMTHKFAREVSHIIAEYERKNFNCDDDAPSLAAAVVEIFRVARQHFR